MSKLKTKQCKTNILNQIIDGVNTKHACLVFDHNVRLLPAFYVDVNLKKKKANVTIGMDKYCFNISDIVDYIDKKSIVCGVINTKKEKVGILFFSRKLRKQGFTQEINAYTKKLLKEQKVNYFYVHDAKIR